MNAVELNNILVAIDGSQPAYRATAMAAKLAEKLGTSLILLHIIRDKPLPKELQDMIEFEQINDSRIDILKNSGQMILDKAKEIAEQNRVVSVTSEMKQGNPADIIVDFAEKNSVDLIVLGRRGLGEVKAMLLGSVSRKVTNLTAINCLTIK